MLQTPEQVRGNTKLYPYGDQLIDSIDLKALVVSRGVRVANEIYETFKGKVRLSKDPLECNTIQLPDDTIIQLTDLSIHMELIHSMLSWDMLSQLKYLPQLGTDFSLKLDEEKRPALYFKKQKITEVRFVEHSDFYKQKTSNGLPYLGNAVLQGTEWLSFPLLWKCDYAYAGEPCQFCFSGGEIASISRRKKSLSDYPTPEDVAEIAEYAILKEKCANGIQITGGSLFDDQEEVEIVKNILNAIDRRIGRKNIPGEIVVYITAPKNPNSLDQLFEAGADRISCSLEVWDEGLASKIMPGKIRLIGRQQFLDSLHYISSKYGKNKACCDFIIGLEPIESVLAGAEYMASHGIVPIASVWIPFGRPVLNSMKTPDLVYYQKFKIELAQIYERYGIVPAGGKGFNVCMCRDVYLNLNSLKVISQ